ncbi:hypothetical protein CRUP_017760 [Coryphaenoides rupestris]|nr:hypothetical protein CRUP_017760 [Coryphaenoides rupestris]
MEIRCFLSEPELLGYRRHQQPYWTTTSASRTEVTKPYRAESTNISSYVTIRRAASAVGWKRLYSVDPALQQQQQLRGKMSADEQLERMKRHQKALVRQRKRTLSHGDARTHASSSRAASSSSSSSTSTPRPLSADLGSVRY